MANSLKRYKKLITDVLYSIIAYALPTFVLYILVQPIIARYITSEENGLFLTILSIIRYFTNILPTPLATLRLLEKRRCIENDQLNIKFNYIFTIITIIGVFATGFVIYWYSHNLNVFNIVLSIAFLLLLFFHDYYSIIFRIIIDFKKITIDNSLIVIGFIVGLGLFYVCHYWQIVFISGYFVGSVYVFIQARKALQIGHVHRLRTPSINKKYIELSATNTLSHSITYCDKLLIYPILGGHDVSVYNAAGVVSKAVSIVSIPVRNVLLSYMVDKTSLCIDRKVFRRICVIAPLIMIFLTYVFSLIGFFLCKYLYPMFFQDAERFISMIVGAMVINTTADMINLILLQFAKTYLQTIMSAVRLLLYLGFVFVFTFVFHKALWGFCWSTFLTSCVYFIIVVILIRKHIEIK